MSRSSHSMGLLLCVLATLGHAPEAVGQFSKLKKAAGQKAADATVNAGVNAATDAATGGPAFHWSGRRSRWTPFH